MYAVSSTSSTSTSGSGRAGSSGVGLGSGLSALSDLALGSYGLKDSDRRIRVIRLLRPRRSASAFGFWLRGGKEYSTGFFISKVEFNSEAHLQGLRVGDQLVNVNGFRVDDAVHSELTHYLASQTRLKVKVRHVGMLPVKEKAHEPVSWLFVSDRASAPSESSSSPTLCRETERITEMRLSILVPPRAKLGCGICKGPDWKPGIYVQFVREGGIAREAGLRPGDQILSCNGYDFSNISFSEAISAMKACGRLDLLIREGAGLELVSPESSGYNSSASSAAGERSPAPPPPVMHPAHLAPPATLRRRLASVAEEAADRADRMNVNRLKRRTWDSLEFDWKNDDTHNFDTPSDIEPDYDSPSIPNNPHTFENKASKLIKTKDLVTSPSNRTIINLTEDGATIQCTSNYDNKINKTTFSANKMKREEDKKTIVVEVHHSGRTNCDRERCDFPPPPVKPESTPDTSSVNSSLSSAIAEEIQRRKMNKINATQSQDSKIPNVQVKKTNVSKPVDEKRKQHDALIDEFKKLHRKMFGNSENNPPDETKTEEDKSDRQQKLPPGKPENDSSDIKSNTYIQPRHETSQIPPPPPAPPMPVTNGHQVDDSKIEKKSIPKSTKTNTSNGTNGQVNNGTLKRTPTPDYNGTSYVNSNGSKVEKAELESLESYKLKSPSNVQPRPPSTYFVSAPNGTSTMKRNIRPVSVTIGEYGSTGGQRKEPSKLDFLNGDKPAGPQVIVDDTPITNRLQSELTMTLSRSNLRKKTDALEHLIIKRCVSQDVTIEDSVSSLDKNFRARYGNNLLPLPPCVTIPKVSMLKN